MLSIRAIYTTVLLLAACLTAFSQTTITGSLKGIVVDPSEAAVAGARVTALQTETDSHSTVETDARGIYSFSRLSPGTYTLTVEKTGFQKASIPELPLSVSETRVVNVSLSVGTTSESVTVDAQASVVQSQTSEISLLIDDRRLKDMPLNGKNYQRLAFLAPGVSNGHNEISNVVVSGARSVANNYTLDGLGNNDERSYLGASLDGGASSGEFGRQGPNLVSTEALQEFRMITSNADASYGRGSGGQINAITKSGTNEFHGSLYDYWRNSALDARDFFNRGPFSTKTASLKRRPSTSICSEQVLAARSRTIAISSLLILRDSGSVLSKPREQRFLMLRSFI